MAAAGAAVLVAELQIPADWCCGAGSLSIVRNQTFVFTVMFPCSLRICVRVTTSSTTNPQSRGMMINRQIADSFDVVADSGFSSRVHNNKPINLQHAWLSFDRLATVRQDGAARQSCNHSLYKGVACYNYLLIVKLGRFSGVRWRNPPCKQSPWRVGGFNHGTL